MYQQIGHVCYAELQPSAENRIDETAGNGHVTGDIITFTDKEILPDTEYLYKVLVTVDKQTSTIENTTAARIVTKAGSTVFCNSAIRKRLCQGSSQKLDFSLERCSILIP